MIAPTPSNLERFRELIGRRLGLHFEEGKLGFLAEVLWRQLGVSRLGCDQYLDWLERAVSREVVARLAHELTVPETYFFRHIDQIRAFAEVAVPDRVKARAAARVLRILSAGCASGEEAYTLAMILREIPIDPSFEVSIRAVDLNPAVLEKAASGRFSTWSLRETPPESHGRWFRSNGREILIDESIRSQVVFEQRNLAEDDPDLWRPDCFDIVFCRNVIMYFLPTTAQAVVDRISRALVPGGYLFLGHAETLRGMSHEFHLRHTHNAFYYQRRGGDELIASPSFWVATSLPPAQIAAPEEMPADSWVEAIGKASDRIRALTDERETGAPPISTPTAPGNGVSPLDLNPLLELLRQERFTEALGMVRALPPESAGDPDVRLLEAVLLAHSGEFARAEQVCLSLLEVDELNAGAHYVLALCAEACGDPDRAVEHHQVASYLDPAFAMPRLHLGLMARRAGEHADARRELGHALELFQREDQSRLLFFGGGFNRDALVALCRAELVACGGRP